MAGVEPCDLDRVFDSFGPGCDKHCALFEITRDKRVQTFTQPDVIFIRKNLMAGVGKAIELLLHSGHNLGVAVARVDHGDPCGKVDIAVTLDMPNLGVFRLFDIDLGLHAHATGDGADFMGDVFAQCFGHVVVRLVPALERDKRDDGLPFLLVTFLWAHKEKLPARKRGSL